MPVVIRSGAECVVDGLCGAQFASKPLRVRVIKELTGTDPEYRTVFPNLTWVSVYELTRWGEAVRQRELLVSRETFLAAIEIGHTPQPIPRQHIREVSYVDA